MSKSKTVNEFLDEAVRTYSYSPLSPLKRRELKFKLGLADIKDVVEPADTSLALDIIIAELKPATTGSVRTAAAFGARQPCPRCTSVMSAVKLSASEPALYCAACHVTVPST